MEKLLFWVFSSLGEKSVQDHFLWRKSDVNTCHSRKGYAESIDYTPTVDQDIKR
jgi:hypothetical protein